MMQRGSRMSRNSLNSHRMWLGALSKDEFTPRNSPTSYPQLFTAPTNKPPNSQFVMFHDSPILSDPRLSKDVEFYGIYEPRKEDAVPHYDRDKIVADLVSFYNFLPHVSTSTVYTAPPGGWPEITEASLAAHNIHKSPEAIDLLRHLPYISGKEPWIMVTTLVCDYRCVIVSAEAREKPGWLYNAAEKQWPAWTVQLTDGTDREGHQYILDTTDGTISRHCCGDHGDYPPTYPVDDPHSWRDRHTDPETVTMKEWLEHWKQEYLKMTVLTIPPDYGGYGSPDTRFGRLDAEPGSYNYEEMHVSRKTHYRNMSQCLLPTLRFDRIDSYLRECVGYTTSTDGPTSRIIRKNLVFKHSSCGIKTLRCVK
jgi:hypothetical protein